jgi:hypothetical protein
MLVITSASWQSIMTKKVEDKNIQQSEKEEKKRLRMERKENKDKNKLNKPIKRKGNKTETSTKPPKAKKRNLRKTDIENENKIDSKINPPSNIKSDIKRNLNVNIISCVTLNNAKYEKENLNNNIKYDLSDDSEEIPNAEGEDENPKSVQVNKGLCFICTGHIGNERPGVKCSFCVMFICKTCQNKLV